MANIFDPTVPTGGELLTPGARAAMPPVATVSRQPPTAAVAAALARQDGRQIVVHLASSERRAEEIGRALQGLAPEIETLVLPPWDCLPYDRASPSPDVMGRRMRVMASLVREPSGIRVLVTSPDALLQRLPPTSGLEFAFFPLRRGERLDRASFTGFATNCGYRTDERVDEPGEFAVLGEVIDIFPADADWPLRVVLDGADKITEIRSFDPVSQRTADEIEAFDVGPASELIHEGERAPGDEHRLPEIAGELTNLFELIGEAKLSRDPNASDRLAMVADQIREAFEAHKSLGPGGAAPLSPSALYLAPTEAQRGLDRWQALDLRLDDVEAISSLAGERHPNRALCALIEGHVAAGRRVVLAGLRMETRALINAVRRGLGVTPAEVDSWLQALSADGGTILALGADLESGFVDEEASLAVVAAPDLLGGRLYDRERPKSGLLTEPDFRFGDIVIHEEHGVGVLRDLERLDVDGTERDVIRLEYHGNTSALIPIDEIGLIWRYGAEERAVGLDRLKGGAWQKRKIDVSRQIDETARHLVDLAKARAATACEPVTPSKEAFAKFTSRFAYPETPDQAAAIASVLSDLASGRPMDRLVCGDVGFGKTEVALRAAAAVALSGRQVAVVAPTTVLARQHLQTFQRRFAGMGIEVAHLSRLVTADEAKTVREGLASGEIRIVVGTHALAGKGIGFADLGLIILDEEQKFGSAAKDQLRALAGAGHQLTLTATPIPRTLQAAMIGIQDVSIIASPPARRRPIRTFLIPFDGATVRTALLRERRRGGQSFLVVPRIEDIEPMALRLTELVPELKTRIAHGDLSADEADEVMVGFADGVGDVLLATNIIESGLDVPQANTMLVWRPDRFGLAQLHQLRGRVGRGRAQGVAYLLSDPEEEMSEATRSRLSTLEALDRLGSGLAISARDLDLRGGGDLIGEEQAGHVKLIGTSLYQRILSRAVAAAQGNELAPDWIPALNLGETGAIPIDYVPDAVTRINLYARLAGFDKIGAIDKFEEELADRFGAPPSAVATLLAFARLRHLARAAQIRQVDAGPKALALTPVMATAAALKHCKKLVGGAEIKEGRLILRGNFDESAVRLSSVETLLTRLAD